VARCPACLAWAAYAASQAASLAVFFGTLLTATLAMKNTTKAMPVSGAARFQLIRAPWSRGFCIDAKLCRRARRVVGRAGDSGGPRR
jgi:hypothetical protein